MEFARVMPTRPSVQIRNDYNGFSKMVHEMGTPVVVTKNGADDLVVMSSSTYNALIDALQRSSLEMQLMLADELIETGVEGVSLEEAFEQVHKTIDAYAVD